MPAPSTQRLDGRHGRPGSRTVRRKQQDARLCQQLAASASAGRRGFRQMQREPNGEGAAGSLAADDGKRTTELRQDTGCDPQAKTRAAASRLGAASLFEFAE